MGVSPFLPELRENSAVSLRLALFLTFVGQNGAGCRAGHGSLQPVGPPARRAQKGEVPVRFSVKEHAWNAGFGRRVRLNERALKIVDGVIEPVHGVRFGNEQRAKLTDRVAEANALKFKRSAYQFSELFSRLFRHGRRQRNRHAVDEFIRGAGERKSTAQLRLPAHRIGQGAETHNQIFGVDIGV